MMRTGDHQDRYTLAEAARELARRECMADGHDLQIVQSGIEPVRLVCGRGCGHHGWTVTPVLCPRYPRGEL